MESKPVFREVDCNNLEFARQIVLQRLRDDSRWTQFDYIWDSRRQGYVLFEQDYLRSRFVELVNEIMWQLIIQGIISPGMNALNPNLPHFHVTEYGRKVLEENRIVPHDPTGYLNELMSVATTTVSKVAIAYVEEALRCFHSGCHNAAVLLLGVAAESVFLEVCTVVESSLRNDPERNELNNQRAIKSKHRWVVNKYQSLSGTVRRTRLPESLDVTLTSLYELIRRQRNELGHPQEKPPDLSREQAFIFLTLFPGFVRDAEAFAEFCRQTGL